MKWLVIFALFDPATGIRSLEYRALPTEQECREIADRGVTENKALLGDDIWIVAKCVNLDKLLEVK